MLDLTHDKSVATWIRPDGRDPTIYQALAKGGRLRLSWEFLIRTEDFQAECVCVLDGKMDPSEVAERWGLYAFKPWNEPFDTNQKPRFLVSWVRKFSAKPSQLVRHVALRPGQVAYVFNLDAMLRSGDSRDAQLALFEKRLERELNRRASGAPVEMPLSRAREHNLDACLQVADLLKAGVPISEIKEIVPFIRQAAPRKDPEFDGARATANKDEVHNRFRDLKNRYNRYINEREYLILAARAHTGS